MSNNYATVQDEREALHPRTIRPRFPSELSTMLFLRQGAIKWNEGEERVTGRAICFWPAETCPKLVLEAGSSARLLGLSDRIILDAIGARAESVHLRMMVERPFRSALNERPKTPQVESVFEWFGFEMDTPARQSPMMLSAYLRLLLIMASRVHVPKASPRVSEQTSLLRRFRHLVELHYKDHWQMSDYAEELGIEYDRLHRICKRETKRTPAELVHERMIAEAKARLEKSGQSLKEIAADLGFTDGSRFSHFFKRRTDMSPGAYRAIVSRPDSDDLTDLRRSFSDWP